MPGRDQHVFVIALVLDMITAFLGSGIEFYLEWT